MGAKQRYALLLEPLLTQAAGYARSLLRNRHDAEDAVQQAALRGFERIGSFDANRPFRGWWFAILRNCCIDILRQTKTMQASDLRHDEPADSPPQQTSDWEHLSVAMSRLSNAHREILQLRYFAGLTYRELAEALSIPEGTVMSRLHLARKTLQATMREEAP